MKSIFYLSIIVLIFWVIKNHSISTPTIQEVSEDNLIVDNPSESSNVEHPSEEIQDSPKKINRTYRLVLIGDFNYEDYSDSVQVVLDYLRENNIDIDIEFVGFLELGSDVFISSTDGTPSNIIDNQVFFSEYVSGSNTIFLTSYRMFDSHLNSFIRGYAQGMNVIAKVNNGWLKETLTHELGHNFDLRHCDDLSCIMATNNDEYDSGKFCNDCKNKLHTYE